MNKKKTTISDVAEKAGVSKSTVSQYINQRFRYMSAETEQLTIFFQVIYRNTAQTFPLVVTRQLLIL